MADQKPADILDQEIKIEGGFVNDPTDPGGRTQFGISERSFPEAWKNGPPSYQTARDIYQQKFLTGAKIELIPNEALKHQVLDYAINSGPFVVIQKLQHLLGVPEDGVIGPGTLAAIAKADPIRLNNSLVDARILMIARVVQKNPKQIGDLFGWLTRALTFRI